MFLTRLKGPNAVNAKLGSCCRRPDASLIWDTVKQSRIIELGADRADYALKAGFRW